MDKAGVAAQVYDRTASVLPVEPLRPWRFSAASQTQGLWSLCLRPKRGCCSNQWWSLPKRWKTTSVRNSIRCRVRRARKQRTSVRLRSVVERTAPAIGPRPLAILYPGAINSPIGDSRFEGHDTEVVHGSRRLHWHGQYRVAADAL